MSQRKNISQRKRADDVGPFFFIAPSDATTAEGRINSAACAEPNYFFFFFFFAMVILRWMVGGDDAP